MSSVSWLFLSQVGRILSQIVGVSVIARLLTPADFGVIAIALMVSNLAGLLRDMGTGPAAIRSLDGSVRFFGGIYSVQLVISLILAAVLLMLAQPLARFYRVDALENVLIIFSVVFPLSALGGVHLIVLERSQRYRDIAAIDLLSYVSGLLVAVALAKAGIGAESLAAQAVVTAALQSVLQRRASGVVLQPTHPRNARSAAHGSLAVTSFHLMNYVVRNSDTGVAGRLASADFVGAYSMAGRIAQMPAQLIGMLVARVSVPILSAEGLHRDTLAHNAQRMIAITLVASAFVCLVLVALRQTVTSLLFGAQWLDSVPSQLVWLLPAAALFSTSAVVVSVMTAFGATVALTRTGVLSAIAHALALLAGLSIDVRLLPASIFMSALMALGIALLQLQTVQKDRSISAVRLKPLIPVVILLIAYALWSDTLVLATNGPEPVRQIGLELLEAGAIALMLSALGAWQWRGWRDRASNDQESAAVRKTV
jgi:PST family polysaccharide transporter